MKIIYFGSTLFSFPTIKKIKENLELVGIVVTKPKPKGRGLKITMPEVAQWAAQVGVPTLMPDDPSVDSFVEEVAKLQPDLFVLSAYGHILSGKLLRVPRLGGINIHPSLLPKYRGAAPIQRALMNGETKTGLTIFFMDEKIDHGAIIFRKEMNIESTDTYGSLWSRLAELSGEIIIDVLRSIEEGSYQRMPQIEEDKIYAPKITKEEMVINWQDSAEKVNNLIRALSPKPGARTIFRGKELVIVKASVGSGKIEPGTVHIENRDLYVGTGSGSIIIQRVKPEGKTEISGLDFVNGSRIKEGEKIS